MILHKQLSAVFRIHNNCCAIISNSWTQEKKDCFFLFFFFLLLSLRTSWVLEIAKKTVQAVTDQWHLTRSHVCFKPFFMPVDAGIVIMDSVWGCCTVISGGEVCVPGLHKVSWQCGSQSGWRCDYWSTYQFLHPATSPWFELHQRAIPTALLWVSDLLTFRFSLKSYKIYIGLRIIKSQQKTLIRQLLLHSQPYLPHYLKCIKYLFLVPYRFSLVDSNTQIKF